MAAGSYVVRNGGRSGLSSNWCFIVTQVQSALSVPVVAYKPTADCSYLQLVNRIQGTHSDVSQVTTKSPPPPPLPPNGPPDIAPDLVPLAADQSQLSYEQQQQYYQYYYAMQYYEYYKQMITQYHNLTGEFSFCSRDFAPLSYCLC